MTNRELETHALKDFAERRAHSLEWSGEIQVAAKARKWAEPRCHLSPCPGCGVSYSSLGSGVCAACEVTQETRRLRSLPREAVFAMTGTPPDLRGHQDWMDDPESWPVAWKGDRIDTWVGADYQPWVVVITGKNGTGKSCRAAELLFRAHRHEPRRLVWVRETDLLAESERRFEKQQLMEAARMADVLVFDELGITRQSWKIDAAWTLAQELINYRYERTRPTIITTHRVMIEHKYSIKECAPSLYDRIRGGAVCKTPDKSWR